MATRSLLISYAGYPYAMNAFMPDNGLAGLAGALIAAGHETLALDLSTPATMDRLFPHDLRRLITPVARRVFQASLDGRRPRSTDALILVLLIRRLESYQRRTARKIAVELTEKVKAYGADFVGLKLWNGDGFTGSKAIAEEIKRSCPGVMVFVGGPHVDLFRHRILGYCRSFDVAAFGEGEETIVGLARYAEGKGPIASVPNILYRDGSRVVSTEAKWIDDLGSLPFPSYDESIYPSMQGNEKLKILVLDESRGCPNQCAFCVHPAKSGRRWRTKTAARVVGEMSQLISRHGVRTFVLAGSAAPAALMKEIAEEILRRELRVEYVASAHVRGSRPEDFVLLRKAGLSALFFGIESGSQTILDRMNKGITVEQTRNAILASKAAGIYTVGSVIVPAPGDAADTMRQTLDLILAIRPDSVICQPAGVYPNTEWATHPEKYGIVLHRDYYQRVLDYKITPLRPLRLWAKFPFSYDGKSFKQIAAESTAFAREVAANGISNLTQESVLIARYCGLSSRDYASETMESFLTGDCDRVRSLIREFNNRTTGPDTAHVGENGACRVPAQQQVGES
jgi:radical SAM superfamily enzyme YgiQ (UPF0313 family)